MSDPEKTSKSDQETPKQTPELSENELKDVVGGASDIFLNIDGIKGESQDTGHKDWIVNPAAPSKGLPKVITD